MILNSLPESIWRECLSVGECHKLHSKLPQAPNTLSFFLIQLPVDHRFLQLPYPDALPHMEESSSSCHKLPHETTT